MAVRLLLLFLICLPVQAQRLFVTSHPAMGTEYKLYLYASTKQNAAEVSDSVFEEIDRIDNLLSNYKDDSELSRINRTAAKGPVRVEPEVLDFLVQSRHWAEVSHGAFDISVGPLMKVWGFYRHAGAVPPSDELAESMKAVGHNHVLLDKQKSTVAFDTGAVELDPGGIGKGFAVDAAVVVMKQWGVRSALLSAGSSTLYALGAPPGKRGWKAVVRGPVPSQALLSVVWLRDTSMSSANCVEKHFVQNGTLYCHIMDPRTGHPVTGRIQAAVLHPSATASDALSNVLFVLPARESFAVLRASAPQAHALVVEGLRGAEAHTVCYRWPSDVSGRRCALP